MDLPRRARRHRLAIASCACVALWLLASCAPEPAATPADTPPAPDAPTSPASSSLVISEADLGLAASRGAFEARASRGFGGAATVATLEYSIPAAGHVRVVVFDVAGRELGRVVDGWRPAGQHSVDFNMGIGRRQVSLYRIEWGGQTLNGKIDQTP